MRNAKIFPLLSLSNTYAISCKFARYYMRRLAFSAHTHLRCTDVDESSGENLDPSFAGYANTGVCLRHLRICDKYHSPIQKVLSEGVQL